MAMQALGFATFIPLLRYFASINLEKKEEAERAKNEALAERHDCRRKTYRAGFLVCFPAAMANFVIGAGWILWHAAAQLP